LICTVLLASVYCSVVVPEACTGGGGSSLNILVYVTNMSLSATKLNSTQPYNLTAGTTYNVTFTFIPTTSSSVTVFNVTAKIGNLESQIASTAVPPFSATTVATVLNYCTIVQKIQLLLNCGLTTLTQLLALDLTGPNSLATCAGDSLFTTVMAAVPAQAAATAMFTVPLDLVGATGTFSGLVGDYLGNVVSCQQGIVDIFPPAA